MLLRDLLSEARTRLDDVSLPYLWSDRDLVGYFSDAEKEACERAKLIEEDSRPNVATVTSLSQSGGVATAHAVAHGFLAGARARTAGADQAGYNVEALLTVIDADNFTYPVDSGTATPATTATAITTTLVAGTIANIDGKANVGSYPLDPRIIEVRSVLWDNHFLAGIARETLNNPRRETFAPGFWGAFRNYFGSFDWLDGGRDWSTQTGTPRYFIDPQEKYLTLVRIPIEDAPIHLSVYRRPLVTFSFAAYDDDGNVDPEILAADTQEPEIAGWHHINLVNWVEKRAYARRDADANDPKKEAEKEALFIASFGIRMDANALRMQRTRRSNQVRMNPSW